MNNKIYIVLMHYYTPAQNGQWQCTEKCEFVNSIKRRHAESATAILDFTNKTIVKDRIPNREFGAIYNDVKGRYPVQIGELERGI